jgi:putative membrane protein
MVAAMSCSALFLVGYVVRMSLTWTHRFEGPDGLRIAYLTLLTSHMILAAATVPLVARTAYLAVKGRLEEHRRIARITFPVWMYVSVTGVIIYFMLYHISAK